MPYIGRDLNRGNYLKLDDISSSFNGSTTTFNLTVGGSAFTPGSAFSILVSIGGVIQEPESAYQVENSEITFANAPTAQDSFFCIALGVALGIGVPGNGTVNGAHLAKPFNYDGFFYLNDASNRVGINSSIPTSALDVSGTIKASSFSGPIGNPSGISTFYDLRVTNNLTVEGTTTTLDTNLVGVDRVEVGANSNTVVGVAITQSGTADILRLYDGASQVVTVDDTGKIGLGTATPGEALHLGDNQKIALGYGEDLTLTHQGTNSVIFSETGDFHIHARGNGDFYLKANDDIFIRPNGGGEEGIKVIGGDGVQLFHANSKRAQTLTNGFQTQHQTPIFQLFGENASATRASNGYLNFYLRDGNSNSYSVARVLGATDNSNGGYGCLQFQTAFNNSLSTKMIITREGNVGIGSENPSAKLDLIGDAKLQGVSIAGVTTVANDTYLTFGTNATANNNLRIKAKSSNNRNEYRSTYQDFFATDLRIHNISNNQHYAYFWNSEVAFFQNGTKRLSTAPAGAKVFGNLQIDSTSPNLLFVDTNQNNDFSIKCDGGSLQFVDSTDNYTTRMSINSSGNVSIVNDLTVGSGGENSALGVRVNSAYAQIKLPDGQTGADRKGNLSFGDNDDFRIVHDGHHNYVTAGTGDIYVSTSSANPVNIRNSVIDVNVDLTLTDTTADSAAGPEFKLFRNSASPANADYLGQIKFAGESSTGVERNYAKITGKILDVTNGSEDGIIEFAHIKAGSQTITGRWRSDSLQLLNGTNLSVNGTSTFESASTFESDVSIQCTGDANLNLIADTGNNNESSVPTINFTQDGGVNVFKVGVEGTAGETFTGSTDNTPYLMTTTGHGGTNLDFAVAGGLRMKLTATGLQPATNNVEYLGTNTMRWARLYTNGIYDGNIKRFGVTSTGFEGYGTQFKFSDAGDCNVIINADTDNVGEEHHPSLSFKQDGATHVMDIGVNGSAVDYTGATHNFGYVRIGGHLNVGLEIATGNTTSVKRLTIDHSGHILPGTDSQYNIGENATRFANLYVDNIYGALAEGTVTTPFLIDVNGNNSGTTTLLTLDNYVGADINTQYSFIDFTFRDGNSNNTPQVKIGAQVTDDSSTGQQGEGSGDFVVQCAVDTASNTMTEMFRCSHDTKITSVHHHPQSDSNFDLGTNSVRWRNGYFDNLNANNGVVITGITTFNNDITVPTSMDATETGGVAIQRFWSTGTITAGNVYKCGKWTTGEGTVQLLIAVRSHTAGNSGTTTYMFQGSFAAIGSLGIRRLMPLTVGTGHGNGPDNGTNSNAWEVLIKNDNNYAYEVYIHVPSGTNNKHFRVTVTEVGRALTFTDISSTVAYSSLTVQSGAILSSNYNHLGNTYLRDNYKINLGDGNDLQLYHNTSSSYIDNNTNHLLIRSNVDGDDGGNIYLQALSGENSIICNDDGAVELYNDNTKTFETTSTGAKVYGGSTNSNGQLDIQSRGTGVYATLSFKNSSGGGEASIGTHSGADTIYYVCPNHLFHIGGAYKLQMTGSTMQPYSGATFDLGSSSNRFDNVYTNDLNLSNEGKTNDVDGTWGSYTIQEGEDDLFLINKRSGKKYKFNLTEVS